MIRVAINGFGRIGRRVFRLALNHPKIQIVAINDLADAKTLSHLLKYDSIHGVLNNDVSFNTHNVIVDGVEIPLFNEKHPKTINWKSVQPDIVIESTGKFKTKSELQLHINNGSEKVILSVPPIEDDIKTIVLGVNESILEN